MWTASHLNIDLSDVSQILDIINNDCNCCVLNFIVMRQYLFRLFLLTLPILYPSDNLDLYRKKWQQLMGCGCVYAQEDDDDDAQLVITVCGCAYALEEKN